jgi:tetratricopeptide (TPR) repeat protein
VALRALPNVDAEGIALYGDALWASGRFDEADTAYQQSLQKTPGSSRALFGRARSLATISRLDEALDTALAAGMAKDPADRPATAGGFVVDLLAALGRPAPACLAQAA